MRGRQLKILSIILVLSICVQQFAVCKRSGSHRGSSPTRGGRVFSGLGRSRNPGSHNYGGSSAVGHRTWKDRLLGRNRNHNNGGSRGGGILGGGSGRGIFGGRNHGSRSNYGASKGGGGGLLGGLGRSRGGMFRNSGVGSHSRGATFKNMIVGAAAGFLAYKAGKAIIKNVARPMMWNNRPYYWGSQYYPHQQYGGGGSYGAGGGAYPGANSRTMCRMPIDPSDPVLGQVYLEDNTRPKEIAWSCNYNEECCGYECCPQHSQYQQQQQSPQYPPQSHHSQYSSSESHSQETQYPPPQSQY